MKILILGLTVVAELLTSPFKVFAQRDPADVACEGLSDTGSGCSGGQNDVDNLVQTIVQILLYVVGAASVIMLIIGGLRYVTSGGDPQATSGARNTIIYSIVGIIVALLAFVAVNFVFDAITAQPQTGGSAPAGSN